MKESRTKDKNEVKIHPLSNSKLNFINVSLQNQTINLKNIPSNLLGEQMTKKSN